MTPTPDDLRRHKRISTDRRAARLLFDGSWHEGVLLDISGGGAALELAVRPPVGRQVVLSDAEFGLIAGEVVRHGEAVSSMVFRMDGKRRGALIDKLTYWHNDRLWN